MRWFVLAVAFAIGGCGESEAQLAVSGVVQGALTQIVLYKDSSRPAVEQRAQAWLCPCNAYTAATVPAWFDSLKANGARVARAEVQAVWSANAGGANNGVGLMACPSQPHAGLGLDGCTWLAQFAASDYGPAEYTTGCSSNPGGPFPCRLDVTDRLRALLESGTPGMHYSMVAFGNGARGPLIYSVELLIQWGAQ